MSSMMTGLGKLSTNSRSVRERPLPSNSLARRLGSEAPHCETVIEEGMVREVLRDQVADFKPDLIAIGTHGRTGIAHAMLGSVAEDLLADAPADVLAVKAW